jgi:hypothetical protein
MPLMIVINTYLAQCKINQLLLGNLVASITAVEDWTRTAKS